MSVELGRVVVDGGAGFVGSHLCERFLADETGSCGIFNTIGERIRPHDGRAVPAFITQALRGEPLTVHGDGSQTRSVGYVGDLVEGIGRLVRSDVVEPANIGNPDEVSMLDLAKMVIRIPGSSSDISFVDRPVDDPTVPQPDITRARELLGWDSKVPLEEALERTVRWFRTALGG
jgi:dTDP-glucose 4,6-dehydratase